MYLKTSMMKIDKLIIMAVALTDDGSIDTRWRSRFDQTADTDRHTLYKHIVIVHILRIY